MLKAAVRANQGHAGIYGTVTRIGRLAVGQKILLRTALVVAMLAVAVTAKAEVAREQAIKIATDDAGGFLGTWVNAAQLGDTWCVAASSKSANPPLLYVVDEASGAILYKAPNADDATVEGRAVDTAEGSLVASPATRMRVHVARQSAWTGKLRGAEVVVHGVLRLRWDGANHPFLGIEADRVRRK